MKRLRKLKDKAGFSLAEMLMTVLILMMVSLIVATGMPAAKNAYEKTVIGANAQAMLSTAVSALRNELGTAWDIRINDTANTTNGSYVTYFKADTGTRSKLSKTGIPEVLEGGTTIDGYPSIVLEDYVAVEDAFIHSINPEAPIASPRALVPDVNTGLYVTYDTNNGISYNPITGIITIKGLKVCKQVDNTPLAELDSLTIRVLSAQ